MWGSHRLKLESATPAQVQALDKAIDARYGRLMRSRKLVSVTAEQVRKLLG
jgi:hypothetical protein